ncbi:MAG TPA: ABC transporter permease [Puia sp.]|nr:ABC transporter permease [Puia sp.]
MFTNYCKIILRNFRRYKSYTLINIAGMAVGIASMVWGYQTYRYAFSFDNFHPYPDQVYRALTYKKDGEGLKGVFPMVAVPMARQQFPAIKAAARFQGKNIAVRQDTGETFQEWVHFADPDFFRMFNFPLVEGHGDLTDRNTVLLTQKVAKKYFGNQDPIGKTLTFYAGEKYSHILTVRGVINDPPLNSTLQFGMLTPFDNLVAGNGKAIDPGDWGPFTDAAFFYIPDPAAVPGVVKGMSAWLPLQNKAREDWRVTGLRLASIRQTASWSDIITDNYLNQRPNDVAAYTSLVLAFLIFLSCCLNFSNTTVSLAGGRLKEIGMRKVMGSTYRQLMIQLLAECGGIVFAAVMLATLFNRWWLPTFNTMFPGIKLEADYFHDRHLAIFVFGMWLGSTLLAGVYPAFYLSRFNPTSIFRGSVRFSGSNLFSRMMLGLQLSISIITVTAAIAFARNSTFQRDYDYGYNIESNMGLVLPDSTTYVAMKNALSGVPGITGLAGSRNTINFGFQEVAAESESSLKEVDLMGIGPDYLDVMGLRLIAGRGFSKGMDADYDHSLLITEKLAGLYGWSNATALGKQIRIDSSHFTVIGILKDFHPVTVFEPAPNVAMRLSRENQYRYLLISARPSDLAVVHEKVHTAWKSLYPLKPFNAFYQNQVKAMAYETTASIATIFSWFGIVSILLMATGLFALVSLAALKKMKEIALRKVMGAAPKDILVLINKSFFLIFIISALLGCLAGLALSRLLIDMIFKINSGVGLDSLLWAVLLLFTIAAVTSGIKVWEAVRTNPVKLLRNE